jgi:hypothetical protein
MMTPDKARELLRGTAKRRAVDWHGNFDADTITVLLEWAAKDIGAECAAQVAEVLLGEELEQLVWTPLSGARLIKTALAVVVPTDSLVERCLTYLSLYFQELDSFVEMCRSELATGVASKQVARDIVAAVGEIEE